MVDHVAIPSEEWMAMRKAAPHILMLASQYHEAGQPDIAQAIWDAAKRIEGKSTVFAAAPSSERS